MTVRSALSLVIFVAVVAAVGWVLWTRPADRALPQVATELYYEVEDGGAIDLVVTGEEQRVRLVTMLARRLPEGERPDDLPLGYGLMVEWLDHSGERVAHRRYVERSGWTWAVGARPLPYRRARLAGDDRWLSDERLTEIPVAGQIPGGGRVRVRLDTSGDAAFIRAFALLDTDPLVLERSLIAPSRKQVSLALKHSGVASWALLGASERRALLSRAWRRIQGLSPDGGGLKGTPVRVEMDRQTAEQRRARLLTLDPGRRLAVNVVGPLTVRLSGGAAIEHLQVDLVADHPVDEVLPALVERRVQPVGIHGETVARGLSIRTDTPASLQLSNPTDRPVALHLSLDNARGAQIFADTVAEPISDMLALDSLARRNTVLLAPEVNRLRAWKTPLRVPAEGLVRLTVRAVRDAPEENGTASITVVALDADGRDLWQEEVPFVVTTSSYERLVSAPDAWISDPVRLFVGLPRDTVAIDIAASSQVLVSPGRMASALPSHRTHELPFGTVRVRYGERTGKWRIRPPEGEGIVEEALLAQTRLETLSDVNGAPLVRRFGTVEPVARGQGEVWLTPEGASDRSESVYCLFSGEGRLMAQAAAPAGHALTGWLWTPSSGLGSRWSISANGGAWRSGVIRQRLTRFRAQRQPALGRVALDAPAGTELFIRLPRRDAGCSERLVGRRFWRVAPGASLAWNVIKDRVTQAFGLGGLGDGTGRLRVVVGPDREEPYMAMTRRVRELDLPLTPHPARRLSDPGSALGALEGKGIVLYGDFPIGSHRVTVTNLSSRALWLRGVVEGQVGGVAEDAGSWVSASEVGP